MNLFFCLFCAISIINLFLYRPFVQSFHFRSKLSNPYKTFEQSKAFHIATFGLAVIPVFNLYFLLFSSITLLVNRNEFSHFLFQPEKAVLERLENILRFIHNAEPHAPVPGHPSKKFTWKRKTSVLLSFLKKNVSDSDIKRFLIESENIINQNLKLVSSAPSLLSEQKNISRSARFHLEAFVEEARLLYISKKSHKNKLRIPAKNVTRISNQPETLPPFSYNPDLFDGRHRK